MKKQFIMAAAAISLLLASCTSQNAEQHAKMDATETAKPALKEGIIPALDVTKNPQLANNRKDTLVIGIFVPKGIFNPIYVSTSYDKYVVAAIFDNLATVNKDGKFEPGLAEKWDISTDKLTYTFHLRKDAKFSDGSPLTAADVAFTITLLHDKAYDGPIDMKQFPLKGAKAFTEGSAQSIEGIRVVDPQNISFTFDKVTALNFQSVSSIGIMSKAYYGKDYDPGKLSAVVALNQKPIGSGPYMLESYAPSQELRLKANPHHYKGKPAILNLIFKITSKETNMQALKIGETDMDDITINKDNVEQLTSFGFYNLHIFPTNGYGYIAFNLEKPMFKDKKVRQALTYGLNRKQIVDVIFQGYADVINIPQSKMSWAYTDNVNKYEYDLEKAKKLLDEAGWKTGKDGIREKDGQKFKIVFTATNPSTINDVLVPVASNNYKELGIDFVAEQMDYNSVVDKQKKGTFDMMFMTWGLSTDPHTTTFTTKGPQNDSRYSNPKIDELYAQGLAELDIEKRKKIYQEAYGILNEDSPYIMMYQRRDMWPINARLKGFDLSSYKNFTGFLQSVQIND